MAEFRIYPLLLGFITRPLGVFCEGLGQDGKADLPIVGWYLEGRNQKILVDTGGGDPGRADPQWMPYKRDKDQSPKGALKKLGVACGDIDLVIITHLHWDHACGNLSFPYATFLVQEKELHHARFRQRGAPGGCPDEILDMEYETVSGDAQVSEGLKTIFTPGHTCGLQGVLVEGEDRRYFIASDNLPLFDNISENGFRETTILAEPENYRASLEKIAGLSAHILPGHDPKVFDQKVYG